MPGPWGLLSTGFAVKSLDDIITSAQNAQLAGISPNLNLNAPDPLAVATVVLANEIASVWELAGALYNGMNPDGASGDQLTSLALITGTNRLPATAASVLATVNVNNGFSQAAGTMFATQAGLPGLLWTNLAAVTNTSGIAANFQVTFQAVATGTTGSIAASTLTVIATTIAGWNSITNAAAGVAGTNSQSDASLRLFRQLELAGNGSTSAAAIQAAILRNVQVANSPLSVSGIQVGAAAGNSPFVLFLGVTAVTVYWNDTNVTDPVTTLPPHSIEVIPYWAGGAPQTSEKNAVSALILAQKAAGIQTYSGPGPSGGPYSVSITDSQGIAETIVWTFPLSTGVNITLNVKVASGFSVSATNVQDAIYGFVSGTDHNLNPVPGLTANWLPGTTAYISSVIGAVFTIPGVLNVSNVLFNGAALDLVAGIRQNYTLGSITPTFV